MVRSGIIHRDPILSLDYSYLSRNRVLPFPFNEDKIFFFGYARVALYAGLKILNLGKGDNIILPNYICNVIAAPLHALNIEVRYYQIKQDLTPLWSSVEHEMDKKTKGLVIVNYFGFPNDLEYAKSFCNDHKIYLIEDNAHGFLSYYNKRPLGSFGDISIFSFRKILPIPEGAALLINNKSIAVNANRINISLKGNSRIFRYLTRSMITNFIDRLGLFRFMPFDVNKFDFSQINDSAEEFNIEKYFVKFSEFSRFIVRHINYGGIIEERRRSYIEWLSHYNNINKNTAIFPNLSDGVVPLYFSILVHERKQFIIDMWKKGIECFPWPFLPRDSKENYFSQRLVCLPLFPFSNFALNGVL